MWVSQMTAVCSGAQVWMRISSRHQSDALVVAVNHYLATKADSHVKDERYIAMLNFIQANYKTVSLADMAAQFNLTEPYISKYIKEKSGKTSGSWSPMPR